MLKKYYQLMLIIFIALGLAGCGGGNDVASTATGVTSASAVTTTKDGNTISAEVNAPTISVKPTAAVAVVPPVGVSSPNMVYEGVNLAGAEFTPAKVPGALNTDYTWPTAADIQYFKDKRMNTVRLPFLWERLQPTLGGEFNSAYLNGLTSSVTAIKNAGMYVVLDVHNYAHYYLCPGNSCTNYSYGPTNTVGGATGPTNAQFANLWYRLALLYPNDSKVIFGLMNEPIMSTTKSWVGSANAAIVEIRKVANNLILVPGNCWTGGWSWTGGKPLTSNPSAFDSSTMTADECNYPAKYDANGNKIPDPSATDNFTNSANMGSIIDSANNYAYDIHQYLDSDKSGTNGKDCTQNGATILVNVTNWLKSFNPPRRGFLGEFAGINSSNCQTAVVAMLDYMNNNTAVFTPTPTGSPVTVTTGGWIGWTWWAAGSWYGTADGFSLEPKNIGTSSQTDAPQFQWLSPYLN